MSGIQISAIQRDPNLLSQALGWINVRDFGAIGDGVTDDTAAFNAAWTAMGTPAAGTFYIPAGTYKISASLHLNGGFTNTNSSATLSTYQGQHVSVVCDGAIVAETGIGNAVILESCYYPVVQLRFSGGGSTSDSALYVTDVTGMFFDIAGFQFGGTLFHANGNDNGTNKIQAVLGGRILNYEGFQAFYIHNTSGFGTIDTVWDINTTNGSQSLMQDCGDVTILHYENYYPKTVAPSLNLYGCQNCHLGVVALGGGGNPLLSVTSGYMLSIDELYVTTTSGVGVEVADAILGYGQISVGQFTSYAASSSTNPVILLDGGNLAVGTFYSSHDSQLVTFKSGASYPNALTVGRGIITNATQGITVESGQYANSSLVLSNTQFELVSSTLTSGEAVVNVLDSGTRVVMQNVQDLSTGLPSGVVSLAIPNAGQLAEPLNASTLPNGITYTTQGPVTTLAGTTAGSLDWQMPEQGVARVGYKKFVGALIGYENTGSTAQTITFPTAFANTPTITSQPASFGATVSTTELTLPTAMSGAVNGVIVVEGI